MLRQFKMQSALLLLTALSSHTSFSGTMGNTSTPIIHSNSNTIISLNAGPIWQRGGQTQTFFLAPEIQKTYAVKKSTKALFDGEVFLGKQRILNRYIQGQLGIAIAANSDTHLSGIIWDDADPTFDNYVYNYKLKHAHIALKGKLLADNGYWFIPWISGSVGAGFNRAYSYNNIPVILEAVPNNNFRNHTQSTLTYTLGIGLQKTLDPHWQTGIGYEFANWGESHMKRAAQQTENNGLTLNHFYTSGVLINLTYIS